jgi:hypothetical protein
MVRYGGLFEDKKDNEIKRAAMNKSSRVPSRAGLEGKP